MEFRTKVEIRDVGFKIKYTDNLLFLGSCFTENIGNKMSDLKFQADINPFGIIYNPVSVANSLKILLDKRLFTKKDLFYDNELWSSYFHHSRFSDSNAVKSLENINNRIEKSSENLKTADYLFITFGTSWIYQLKETGEIVSNCHRTHAARFNKILLKPNEIIESYNTLINNILSINTKLKIIFTVSPIRHWKDGADGNQLSKSTLIVAIHELINQFSNAFYFPSYEIVMDELRDYRFYDQDMLHINQIGINYIWEKFCESFFDNETKEMMNKIEKINKAISHRPVNPNSENHIQFREKNLEIINNLMVKYPFIDFKNEIDFFGK